MSTLFFEKIKFFLIVRKTGKIMGLLEKKEVMC